MINEQLVKEYIKTVNVLGKDFKRLYINKFRDKADELDLPEASHITDADYISLINRLEEYKRKFNIE